MSCAKDQASKRLCEKHFGSASRGCFQVSAEQVLKRLSRAKDTGLDPQLILVDVREWRVYKTSHILTALSLSCHTKTMAKRAIVTWDLQYALQQGCPAPLNNDQPSPHTFCAHISQISAPALLVYNQNGDCPFCPEGYSVGYFISALLLRSNHVFFMIGGFNAFQALRSSDFIDRGLPVYDGVGFMSADDSDTCHSLARVSARHLPPIGCNRSVLSISGESLCHLRSYVQPLCSSFDRCASEVVLSQTAVSPYSTRHLFGKVQSSVDDPDDVLNASISEILPYLYIGNARDAQDLELLSRLGISHIINVTNSVPMPFRDNAKFHYLHLPASDNNGQNLLPAFEDAVQFIHEARKSKGIVLVHCQAGVSRSVAVVMAFIMHMWPSFNVLRALEFVQMRRPVAGPNLHFMGQLQRYHDDLRSGKTEG